MKGEILAVWLQGNRTFFAPSLGLKSSFWCSTVSRLAENVDSLIWPLEVINLRFDCMLKYDGTNHKTRCKPKQHAKQPSLESDGMAQLQSLRAAALGEGKEVNQHYNFRLLVALR